MVRSVLEMVEMEEHIHLEQNLEVRVAEVLLLLDIE
tara:strand:+ start:55 stop:162 length:108 start_codon:yes stop_codon:yes gene_type:complete